MQPLLLTVLGALVCGVIGQEFLPCPVDDNPCQNYAPCVGDGASGDYVCQCVSGWAGKNCEVQTLQNCGFNQFGTSGSISSPNYPLMYASNSKCHYYVRVLGAKELTFTVQAFDTEFDKDALQYAPGVLWNFSGKYDILEGNLTTVANQFTIPGNEAWFVFESDRTVEKTGFLLTYSAVDPTNCASNLCQNGASCTDVANSYFCTCAAGYDGINCDINVDDCAGALCTYGTMCYDGIDSYTCECPPGYTGDYCETSCIRRCHTRQKLKCGTDGLTYKNRCLLLNAQCNDPTISFKSRGPCPGIGPIAIVGGNGKYCIRAHGINYSDESDSGYQRIPCPPPPFTTAPTMIPPNPKLDPTAESTITPCPTKCPLTYEPVCGSDGETYANKCTLEVIECQNTGNSTLVFVSNGACPEMTTPKCRGDC